MHKHVLGIHIIYNRILHNHVFATLADLSSVQTMVQTHNRERCIDFTTGSDFTARVSGSTVAAPLPDVCV